VNVTIGMCSIDPHHVSVGGYKPSDFLEH